MASSHPSRWVHAALHASTVFTKSEVVNEELRLAFSKTLQDVRVSSPITPIDKTKTHTFQFEYKLVSGNVITPLIYAAFYGAYAADTGLPSVITELGGGWFRRSGLLLPSHMTGSGNAVMVGAWGNWNANVTGEIHYRNFMLSEGDVERTWNDGGYYDNAINIGAIVDTDPRLTDTRTPTTGTVTNTSVAADANIDLAKLNIPSNAAAATPSLRALGTGATQAAAGNDTRLTNQRTPTDLSVTNAKVSNTAAIAESKLALASDAAAGTASRRTLGTGANQAAPGNATVNLTGDQTINGLKTFATIPRIDHLLYGYSNVATLHDLANLSKGVVDVITVTTTTAYGTSAIWGPSKDLFLDVGRLYKLTWQAINVVQTVAGDGFIVSIQNWTAGTYLAQQRSRGAAQWPVSLIGIVEGTGTVQHFNTQLRRGTGTGTAAIEASTTSPSRLIVEDVGPATTTL